MRAEQVFEGQIRRAMHPAVQGFAPVLATDGVQHGQQVALVHGATRAALPQTTHHGVQAVTHLAQAQVQAQADQGPLGVIADGDVGRVVVGPVILGPGLKARLGQRMHMATRCLQHLVDGFVQPLHIAGVVHQPTAAQQQVVVVAGQALKKPQQLGVVFAGPVVALKFSRAQAFDVPGVKVLMADQAQQGHVAFAGFSLTQARQIAALRNQSGAVAVLQTPIAVVHGIEHEHIAVVGRCGHAPCGFALAVPKADLCFANALGVAQQACAIKTGKTARHHKTVRNAAGFKFTGPKGPHLHGRVDQFVVISGLVVAPAFGVGAQWHQGGRHAPICGHACGVEVYAMQGIALAVHPHKKAGAVEKPARAIQPRGAHRVVVGMHPVVQHQGLLGVGNDVPTGFVVLHHRQLAARLRGPQIKQLLGKLAHHVAAGNPHRELHPLLGGGLGNGAGDVKHMGSPGMGLHFKMHGYRWGGAMSCHSHIRQVAEAPSKQDNTDTAVRRARRGSQSAQPHWAQLRRSTP